MRPQRQVRRSYTRPVYGRRPAPPRRRTGPQLPKFQLKTSTLKLAIISTAVLAVLVGFAQATKINTINIVGAKSLDKEHLHRVAVEGTKKQWFGRNLVLLNGGDLSSHILTSEPGVKDVDIKRKGLHSVDVVISERQPTLNWKTNGVLYLLDLDGTVIGESKGPYVQLPVVIDSTNLPVKLGDRVAPSSFVTFCAQMYNRLPEAGVKAVDMTVPETTTEVNVKTDKAYIIKMDTMRTVEGELTDLKAVQEELKKAKKTPKEYIDLRIEHKAYYK